MKWIASKSVYILASLFCVVGIVCVIPAGICVAAALALGTLGDWMESGVWNEDN